jgi:hypothetical protein
VNVDCAVLVKYYLVPTTFRAAAAIAVLSIDRSLWPSNLPLTDLSCPLLDRIVTYKHNVISTSKLKPLLYYINPPPWLNLPAPTSRAFWPRLVRHLDSPAIETGS